MNITTLYTKALCLICIFLCVQYSSNAELPKADSLFSIGAYQQAAILYEKQVFQNQSVILKKTALLHKSYCYKALGQNDIANEILKRGLSLGSEDSLDYLMRYESVINNYLNNSPEKTISEINLIKFYFPQKNSSNLITLNIMALNDLGNWSEAQRILKENQQEIGISLSEIEQLYNGTNNFKLKKPNKAFNLSILLPGMGQVYAGHLAKGMLSLVLQTATMSYGIYGLKNSLFFTAAVPGVAAFNMFYMGGAEYAKRLSISKNQTKIDQINRTLNTTLLYSLGQ